MHSKHQFGQSDPDWTTNARSEVCTEAHQMTNSRSPPTWCDIALCAARQLWLIIISLRSTLTPQCAGMESKGFAIYKVQTRWPASALINKNYPRSPVGFCWVTILGSLVQAARVVWSLAALLFIIPSSELQGVSLCVFSERSHYLWCRTMAHFPAREGFVKSDDVIMGLIPFSVSSRG